MNLMRTTAGISKAEDNGRKDAQIMSADALRRVFPTTVASPRIPRLGASGGLTRANIGNI